MNPTTKIVCGVGSHVQDGAAYLYLSRIIVAKSLQVYMAQVSMHCMSPYGACAGGIWYREVVDLKV